MVHKIKCTSCKNYFGKILCPQCLKINPLSKNFFKTGTIVCSFTSCAKKSEIINCIYCRRINVFNNENEKPIPGQQIKCTYKDCEKIFNEVYSPSCEELNPIYEGDFILGKFMNAFMLFVKKSINFLLVQIAKFIQGQQILKKVKDMFVIIVKLYYLIGDAHYGSRIQFEIWRNGQMPLLPRKI